VKPLLRFAFFVWGGHSCPPPLTLNWVFVGDLYPAVLMTFPNKINFKGGGQECPPHTGLSGGYLDSVHGQDAHATGAAAGAAQTASIAGGGLHLDVETSGSGDHGGFDRNRGLRTTVHHGRKGGAIEENQRRGNKLAAGGGESKAGRQL
jgi:hypothetical protein